MGFFFITVFMAGGHNTNGSYYMIIAASTQVSEIMHDKEVVLKKKRNTLELDLEGLI